MGIKRIEQEDVEEATAIKIGDSTEQAQSGGLLAFARQEPLDRQKRFDRAADDLAADRPVVVRHLFDFDAAWPRCDTAFQTGVAATAVAGEYLDAIPD